MPRTIPPARRLCRRDLLRVAGAASLGAALSSCGLSRVSTHPAPLAESSTLRALAERLGFNIGVLVYAYGCPTCDETPEQRDLREATQKREFNLAEAYLDMRMTQPRRGEFAYGPPDHDVALAAEGRMKTFGHPLVWFDGCPDWVRSGAFGRDELVRIMTEHIAAIVGRYKGRVNAWTVVNEAYSRPGDFLHDTIGPEYVTLAFEAARAADPAAVLVYNDYDNHTSRGALTSHTREILKPLVAKGLVDAVGLQMHLTATNPPDKQDVAATMRSYGLPVYVTEFDVNIGMMGADRASAEALQARIYGDMLQAALESGVCRDFIVFGIVDRLSVWEWLSFLPGFSPTAAPTPYDDQLRPKPAYDAMRDVLTLAQNGRTRFGR